VRKILSNETRNLLIQTYEKSHDAKKTACIYGVSVPTVYRLAAQKAKTGSVELHVNQRGRKKMLGAAQRQTIQKCVEENPEITLLELTEKLDVKVSIETVRRVLREMGYYRKKRALYPSESRPADRR